VTPWEFTKNEQFKPVDRLIMIVVPLLRRKRRKTEAVMSATPPNDFTWDAIELAPDLPVSVFTSMEPWHPERIGAIALYCSDGRWGEAFDEFCHKHLLIPRYDRWAVPGGPAWLATTDETGAFYQTAREQLDFLIRFHELERIVLITHFGCAYYGHRLNKPP